MKSVSKTRNFRHSHPNLIVSILKGKFAHFSDSIFTFSINYSQKVHSLVQTILRIGKIKVAPIYKKKTNQ